MTKLQQLKQAQDEVLKKAVAWRRKTKDLDCRKIEEYIKDSFNELGDLATAIDDLEKLL